MVSRKQLLEERDETIDRLLENEKMLKAISSDGFFEEEREALEKTQESLLAHLIHLQTFLDERRTEPSLSKQAVRTSQVRRRKKRKAFLQL